jgi:hypothetical protein
MDNPSGEPPGKERKTHFFSCDCYRYDIGRDIRIQRCGKCDNTQKSERPTTMAEIQNTVAWNV